MGRRSIGFRAALLPFYPQIIIVFFVCLHHPHVNACTLPSKSPHRHFFFFTVKIYRGRAKMVLPLHPPTRLSLTSRCVPIKTVTPPKSLSPSAWHMSQRFPSLAAQLQRRCCTMGWVFCFVFSFKANLSSGCCGRNTTPVMIESRWIQSAANAKFLLFCVAWVVSCKANLMFGED